MKNVLAIIPVTLLAAASFAQTGTYSWQLSTDGVTWSSVVNTTAGTTVHVRLLASWSGVTGTSQGYAGGQFDAIIQGADASDTISNIVRPAPFAGADQTLVASTYAGGVKIDTTADVAAPGAGTGWIIPGQPAADFAPPGGYNSYNPAIVFSFDVLTNEAGVNISCVLNAANGRALAVYNTSSGSQTRISASAVVVTGASILIPTPGSLSLFSLGVLAGSRRQRRTSIR